MKERFQYGAEDDAPWLECQIPVMQCNNACNGTHGEPPFTWLDWRAEEIKHRTVVEALLRAESSGLKDTVGGFADRLATFQRRYDALREVAERTLTANSLSEFRAARADLVTALADGQDNNKEAE